MSEKQKPHEGDFETWRELLENGTPVPAISLFGVKIILHKDAAGNYFLGQHFAINTSFAEIIITLTKWTIAASQEK